LPPVNITVTLAGIAGIIVSFVVLNSLVQFSTQVLAVTWFRHHTAKLTNLRQNATVVLLVFCILLWVSVSGVNGVLIFQGKRVLAFDLNLLGSILCQFWILGIADSEYELSF